MIIWWKIRRYMKNKAHIWIRHAQIIIRKFDFVGEVGYFGIIKRQKIFTTVYVKGFKSHEKALTKKGPRKIRIY